MENRNQKQRKVTANGFKPLSAVVTFGIMLLMVFLAAFAFKSCSASNHTETANQAVMDEETKAQMEQELLAIADSLDAMDGSVTENLTELSGFNESTIERVENLESTISKVREVINNYLETDTSKSEDVTNGLSTISEELLTVQESLTGTKDKLLALLSEMETADSERVKEIEAEFVKVAEMLDSSKNQLSMTYESLVGMIDILRVENSDSTKEVLTILEEVEKELSLTFFEKVATLSEEIKAGNASLESKMLADAENMTGQMSTLSDKITEDVNALQGKLSDLSTQINTTQSDISELLSMISENEAANQEEIKARFEDIKDKIATFKADFEAAHEELKGILSEMSVKAQENHEQLLNTLSKMDADMSKASEESLSKITDTLVSLEETYISELSQFESSMNQSFTDVNNGITSLSNDMVNNISNMESNISGDLSEMTVNLREDVANMNQNITTNLEDIQNSITTQHVDVTNIVNQMDNGIMDYMKEGFANMESQMQSVFQSVSSGKNLLASALLTRGVNCASDATFQEIYDAIMSIPQTVTIGVDKLPGEISYDYHYHVNASGQTVNASTQSAKGGCYTVSAGHVHNNCPTKTEKYCPGNHTKTETVTYYEHCGCFCVDFGYGERRVCCQCGAEGGPGEECKKERTGTRTVTYSCSGCQSRTYYTCGSPTNRWSVGCGMSHGQIIGAHIVYPSAASAGVMMLSLEEEATPFACAVEPLEGVYYEPMIISEEIVEEEVAEVEEQVEKPDMVQEAEDEEAQVEEPEESNTVTKEEEETDVEPSVEEMAEEIAKEPAEPALEDTVSEEVTSSDTAVEEPVEISNEEITE